MSCFLLGHCQKHLEGCNNPAPFDLYERCPKSLRWAVVWKNDKRKKNDNNPQQNRFCDLFSFLISVCASCSSSALNSETFTYILKTFTARVCPFNSSFPTLQLGMPLEAHVVSKNRPGFSDQNDNKTITRTITISAKTFSARTVSTSGDVNRDLLLFRRQIFLTEL